MSENNFRRYPVGKQDFKQIREGGFVYVDKTRYVWELANRFGDSIFLSRPRRFGKTLLCSTLKHYFLGHRELFAGLAIDSLETEWAPHAVLHFDMSRAKSDDVNVVRDQVVFMLETYERQWGITKPKLGIGGRLQELVLAAHQQTGRGVVLIFDEYDSPVLHVIDKPEVMAEIRSMFNEFYGPVKSMYEHLRFVFITGITKFSQMSIFSSINNLDNISFDSRMEALCGITSQELEDYFGCDYEDLGKQYGYNHEQVSQALRDRYDGYRFGRGLTEIYNPFSIIKAFGCMKLGDYWFDSATPLSLLKLLSNYAFTLANIEGGEMLESDFNQPFDNFDTALPILFQSGYLTIKDHYTEGEDDIYTVGIPNGEVYRGFYNTLMLHYLDGNSSRNTSLIRAVAKAMRADDIDAALTAVQSYLSALPYHLSNKTERDFETILHVLFDAIGINVDTEVKNAKGRCDVVMRTRDCVYVLELKIDGTATVDDALAQIDEKNYLIPYWNDPRPKVKVGVVLDRDTRTIKEWKVVAD
ncbi:MAG: AAA family ATPase [Muribaculaceae bacterium]|nr:AAA family ATPase [Muribaculaceae bacterium]